MQASMRDCAYCWGFVRKIKKARDSEIEIKREQDGERQIRQALKHD